MGKEFRALNIERERIIQCIEDYCNLSFKQYKIDKNFIEKDETRRRINIVADDNFFYIDFHFNNDGTTTIEDFGGTCVEIKKLLSYYIKEKCEINDKNEKSWFAVKNIEPSDFESILEILEESDLHKKDHITIKENKNNNTIYRLKGKYNEDLVITYYPTRTVEIQGKPLLFFNEAMTIFSELIEIEELPQIFNSHYDVNIDKDEIRERYKLIMKNSYNKITGKLKTCIHQAIYYTVIKSDMFDYSSIPLTAFRALEGHMKYVLKEYKIPTNKNMKLGNYFYKKGKRFILKDDTKNNIKNNSKINNLEKAYNKYNNIRHALSHWDDLDMESNEDTTELINNIEVARQHILDVLSIIDEYYVL